MTLSTKIIIAVTAIVAICLASFIIYKQIEISNQQTAIETQVVKQKELVDGITRSMNEYASKNDIEKFIKDNGINLKAIQADMSTLHAEIKSVNVVTIISGGKQGDNLPTDHTGPANPNPQIPTVPCNGQNVPCPNADQFGYLKNRQDLPLTEPFGTLQVPIGEVGFSAWKPMPWMINIRPRTYKFSSVTGIDENQREYFYNKMTITVDGKDYDVKIDNATTKQIYPTATFSWWNPRLFLGIDGGYNLTATKGEFTPSANIGIMSYGMYKNQPDFSILEFGIGYGSISNKAQLVVTPATYNVGKHIPLMTNMYIGPSIHFGTNGDVSLMGGLRVGL